MRTIDEIKADIEAYKEDYSDSTKPIRVARLEQMVVDLVELCEQQVNRDDVIRYEIAAVNGFFKHIDNKRMEFLKALSTPFEEIE